MELRHLRYFITVAEELHFKRAFVCPPVETQRCRLMSIFEESLCVAMSEVHSLGHQAEVSLRSLSHEPFILFPRPLALGLYDQIISLCQQAGFSPNVAQEAIQM